MRALRVPLLGTVMLGLLLGPTGAAVCEEPAAVTESPSPMTSEESSSGMDAFPTGYFVPAETGSGLVEFHGQGTGSFDPLGDLFRLPFKYAVDGDMFTSLWAAVGMGKIQCGPADYRWAYDGGLLTFELIGEDDCERRKTAMVNGPFQPIEDPQLVMVATIDLDVGDPIRAWEAFVPAAEVGPDAYTSKVDYLGRVAAVPIAKGQPITPDVVELPAE